MDNVWPWLIGVLVAVALVAVLLPVVRRQAPKKPEATKIEEEFAEEISPVVIIPTRKEPDTGPDIPHNYGVDRMVLSYKDPNWLHAYWEISVTKHEEFLNLHGKDFWSTSQPVIRVYDITGLSQSSDVINNSYRELYLDPWADNWFIEVGEPDRTFFVELGRLFVDGKYVKILRSNTVTTPRASLSDRLDQEWMWAEGIYKYIGQVTYGMSSLVLTERQIIDGIEAVIPSSISSPGIQN